MVRLAIVLVLLFFVCLCYVLVVRTDDGVQGQVLRYTLTIENHHFIPEKLEIPAGRKAKLTIKNNDDSVEEFESFDLKREKIVPANTSITVNVGPLTAGEYKFFGEFHEDTAQGKIVVK